jgi:general secretion pathway protein F
MPSFAYKGVSRQGRPASGVVEADSVRGARARLREQGVFASDVRETEQSRGSTVRAFGARRVRVRDLGRALRQLATLLAAGVPLVDAVGSVRARQLPAALSAALGTVKADLIAGESFERALRKHPGVFPPVYVGMVRAGEASGALDTVLVQIAEHAESSAQLQAQFRSAMTYPVIMMLVGTGIVVFLLTYVVPQVTRVFLEAGQRLPLPTRALMAAGRFTSDYGLLLLGMAGAGALGLRYYAGTPAGSRRVERLFYSTPWIGPVLRNVAMARFAHTMATTLSGGMTLVDALGVCRGVTGSALVSDALDDAAEAVSRGDSLAPTLARAGLFNPMVVDMIAVGERSGSIDKMMVKAAQALDEEVRNNVDIMAGVMEPMMILLMAGVVLLVVLAVMLPVFEMNQMIR